MRPASYQPIVDRLAIAIRCGALSPGTRLPTHRALAHEHRIAVATATRVYAELTAMGLVVGERGRGTYVRDQPSADAAEPARHSSGPRVADLSFNQPLAEVQGAQLRRALRDLSDAGDLEALLHQQPVGGRSRDRAAVATYLLERGLDVAPAEVLLTHGAQHALDVALGALARPGAIVAADALTYPGLTLIGAARSLEIAPVPVTAAGPELDALDRLCRSRPVRAVYAIPTVHNPLGWTLDRAHRERLVDIARRHDCLLIEDGTYAFLDDGAPPPLYALAPERTCYVASLSKNIATGLRFGYVVAPRGRAAALTRSLRASTWGVSGIVTALAVRWLADGTVVELEKARRADAEARQAIARATLRTLDYTAHRSSHFGWLELPARVRADRVAARLADAGILVSTADAFATTPTAPHALRLALATPPLDRLGAVLERVLSAVAAPVH
jgi:DNA-binding transcriptional MocR family regulator